MGDKPTTKITVLMLGFMVVLLIAAGLLWWWSDQRVGQLEQQLTDLGRLEPKLNRLREDMETKLERLWKLEQGIEKLQSTLAPLEKMNLSMNLLAEKVGKDIVPEVAKLTEVLTRLGNTESQLKAVAEALTTTKQQLTDRVDKQSIETGTVLTSQMKKLDALEASLKGIQDAQAGLLTEVAKLEAQLQDIAKTQEGLAESAEKMKTLTEQVDEIQKTVERLRKNMEEVQRKLSDARRSGPPL